MYQSTASEHTSTVSLLALLPNLLAVLEVPSCNCPLDLSCPCRQECPPEVAATCRHCQEKCDCPPLLKQPPCRHMLAVDWDRWGENIDPGTGKPITFERWLVLMWAADFAGHQGQPAPLFPNMLQDRAARVAWMRNRHTAHLGLFDEQPLPESITNGLAVPVHNLRNGQPRSERILTEREARGA